MQNGHIATRPTGCRLFTAKAGTSSCTSRTRSNPGSTRQDLAAGVARLSGTEVNVLDRVETGPKPELVRAIGATYHTGRVLDLGFEPDVIIECTGAGSVIADSIQKVAAGGIICLTGVGTGGIATRAVADVAAAAVLKNNVLIGSVNANKHHWYKANQRLVPLDRKWLRRLITRIEKPANFKQALERKPDDITVVIQFSEYQPSIPIWQAARWRHRGCRGGTLDRRIV